MARPKLINLARQKLQRVVIEIWERTELISFLRLSPDHRCRTMFMNFPGTGSNGGNGQKNAEKSR